MALSPIQMFQNDQNSLAAILQGGNNTITSILDKAVQVGRDISNKQLQQERDLIGMRQAETNMEQRRAENLQQNFEDFQRFSRNIFESDRRAAIEQSQEQRAGVRDLFDMENQARRTNLAEQELDLGREKFDLDKVQAGTEMQKKIEQERATRRLAEGEDAPRGLRVGIVDFVKGALGIGGSGESVTLAEERLTAARKTGDPALIEKAARNLEAAKAGAKTNSGKSLTPTEQETQKLRLEEMKRKDRESFIKDTITLNPRVFGKQGTGETKSLMELSTKLGKKPEDVLYSKDFDEYFKDAAPRMRTAIEKSQIGAEEREIAAINASASEQEYVDAQPGLNENEKNIRRELYRRVRGKGGAAAPTAAANWWEAQP